MPNVNRKSIRGLSSPMVILMIVLVLLAISSYFLFGRGSGSSGKTYFYDMEVGKVFTADITDELPPIQSPLSGKQTGAYFFIFGCGSCTNYDGMTVEEVEAAGGAPGYLAIYSDQARAAFKQTGQIRDFQAGRLVKRITDEKWMPSGSMESALASEVRNSCGQGTAKVCEP